MNSIAWPAAVVVIAILFMAMFRRPLERLLDRTKKIGTAGLDASAATAQETSIERPPSGAEESLARFDNRLLVEQETAIRNELSARRIDSPVERERVLVRHLAATQIRSHFERLYHLIFGSQLSMLQQVNAATSFGRDEARASYDFAVMGSPDFYANYSFDQWLNFMISQNLVRADGDVITITVPGREFLTFLIQEGLSFIKPG